MNRDESVTAPGSHANFSLPERRKKLASNHGSFQGRRQAVVIGVVSYLETLLCVYLLRTIESALPRHYCGGGPGEGESIVGPTVRVAV
jgi:hypothetical protein